MLRKLIQYINKNIWFHPQCHCGSYRTRVVSWSTSPSIILKSSAPNLKCMNDDQWNWATFTCLSCDNNFIFERTNSEIKDVTDRETIRDSKLKGII